MSLKRENMEHFRELGLSENTIQTLRAKGFEEPTEIQSKVIPHILKGDKDVIAQAQTGTGKTAAFGLPLIETIAHLDRKPQALILAPTRELVIQVCEEIHSLKGNNPLVIAPIYGGQSIDRQLRLLKQGVSVVVGTPGRILDHLQRKSLDLSAIQYFVLDEADEMLNMGFAEDIETIFKTTPVKKRVLLFSATMPAPIKKLAERYMGPYTHIRCKTNLTTNLTDQIYFEVLHGDKFEALCRIVDIEPAFYGLVFCRTKIDVDELVGQLLDRGYLADGLHGDISQVLREKVLNKFRKKNIAILVATDVAARGIDVENLTHVVNFSIPQNPEAYIHRIGRTGRAGRQGTAITFVTPAEFRKLGFIRSITKADIKKQTIPEIKDIIAAKKETISRKLTERMETGDVEGFKKWAKALLKAYPPEVVVAVMLKQAYGTVLDENNYRKLTSPSRDRYKRSLVEEEGKTRLFIARGRSTNTTKRDLIDFIVQRAGTPQHLIDNVELHNTFSFITVPFAEAENILKKFQSNKPGKRSLVTNAKPRVPLDGGGPRRGPNRPGGNGRPVRFNKTGKSGPAQFGPPRRQA